MSKHVIKYDYKDGQKLALPELWCSAPAKYSTCYFLDAGHLSLSIGGSAQPCKNCLKAIIKELSKEL